MIYAAIELTSRGSYDSIDEQAAAYTKNFKVIRKAFNDLSND